MAKTLGHHQKPYDLISVSVRKPRTWASEAVNVAFGSDSARGVQKLGRWVSETRALRSETSNMLLIQCLLLNVTWNLCG